MKKKNEEFEQQKKDLKANVTAEAKKENDLKHTQALITVREKSAKKIRKLKKQITEL